MPEYIPSRGDLVWLTFTPQAGHEQARRRPALVLSPQSYNRRVGLALFCPITSHEKGYSFEVKLPDGLPITGVIPSDQLKSLDWRAREIIYVTSLPEPTIREVLQKTCTLLR